MSIINKAMKLVKLETEPSISGQSILEKYSDNKDISAWAKEAVEACVNTSIVTGISGDIIAPKSNITRGEVATMVAKLLQKSGLI